MGSGSASEPALAWEPEQVSELSHDCQALATDLPLWVSVDQEGGRVARLKAPFTVWPPMATLGRSGDPALLSDVSAALIQIRGANSQASVSMKTEISLAKFYGPAHALAHLQAVETDLRAVGRITGEISWVETDSPIAVDVTLASPT